MTRREPAAPRLDCQRLKGGKNGGLDCPLGVSHHSGVRKPSLFLALLLTLLMVAGVVALRYWAAEHIGYQDADPPLGMPVSGPPDHRFLFLSPWQTASIPRALRFDLPMGTEHGALVYNAQLFWDMNEKRGGHHTGDDLNGIGGDHKLLRANCLQWPKRPQRARPRPPAQSQASRRSPQPTAGRDRTRRARKSARIASRFASKFQGQ